MQACGRELTADMDIMDALDLQDEVRRSLTAQRATTTESRSGDTDTSSSAAMDEPLPGAGSSTPRRVVRAVPKSKQPTPDNAHDLDAAE